MSMRWLPKDGVIPLALVAVSLIIAVACGGSAKATPTPKEGTKLPVNETFAADLTAKGVPTDLASFFAAAKIGATREITMKFTPNQQYTPTPEETAKATPGGSPIYAITYSNTLGPDRKGRLDMSYFVPNDGIPADLLASL